MPFQVSLCVSTRNLGALTISLLNNEIYAPCTDTVDLIATFVSGHTNGHSFLWELAEGAQVIFTTPVNQLTASCSLIGVPTDRIFHFWVDKNRPTQELFILHFWGTITETTPFGGSNIFISSGLTIDNGSPNCATIIGTQAIFNSNPTGLGIINPTSIILVWQLPTNLIGLQSIQVEQDINGVWTSVLTLLPTDPQILTNATQNTYYRIKTVYLKDHQYYSQYSCVYDLLIDTSNYNAYIDDVLDTPSNIFKIASLLNFTLLTSDSVTNELVESRQNNNANVLTNFNVTNFTLADPLIIPEDLTIYNSNYFNISSIVYLGGTTIGG